MTLQLPDPNTLGDLVRLSVQVELEDADEDENEEWILIYVWAPNKLLNKDKDLGVSYMSCMSEMMWSDWSQPFRQFMKPTMCETGEYEIDEEFENVRFDDSRIQVHYIDPLNPDYNKRYVTL